MARARTMEVEHADEAFPPPVSAAAPGTFSWNGMIYDCPKCPRIAAGVKAGRFKHSRVGTCTLAGSTAKMSAAQLAGPSVSPTPSFHEDDTASLLISANMGFHDETFNASVQARVPSQDVSVQTYGLAQPCSICGVCRQFPQLLEAASIGDEGKVDEAIAAGTPLDHLFNGWAPLHHLASVGNGPGIRLLLSKGADVAQRAARHQPPDVVNHRCGGESPLHVAARAGHRNTAALLIASGAPLEQYDDHGLLPLHVAALTEIFESFADFDGSIAEQLLLAGANPWARTFNPGTKRPAELADGGFDIRVSCYHMAEVPPGEVFSLADSGAPPERERAHDRQAHRGAGRPTAAQTQLLKAMEAAADSTKLKTDCLQTNNKMHLFLDAAVTPGTHVFKKAQQAECERTGTNSMYTETNANRQNSGQYEGSASDLIPSSQKSTWNVSQFLQMRNIACVFKTPTRLDGVENSATPTLLERAAVHARGNEEDNFRLRTVVAKMEHQILDLQRALIESDADLLAGKEQVDGFLSVVIIIYCYCLYCDQVDELLLENSALRTELEEVRHHDPDDGPGELSNRDSDEPSEGSDELSLPTKGRSQKAEQTRKARARVGSGVVLSRSQISGLNKAEARAYLGAIPNARVRGNATELKDRLREIFDANGLDTFKKGDTPAIVPSGPGVRFCVPPIPSADDLDTD